jgi:hypothetical protein
MNPNTKGSEQAALLGVIAPSSQGAGALSTAWVAAKNFHRFLAIIQSGVLGASATLDAKLQQATDGTGTGVKDVTGKSITQFVKASNDGNQALIDCSADDLDVANSFNFLRLTVTVGTAASLSSAVLLGMSPRFAPASDFNPVTVVQVAG